MNIYISESKHIIITKFSLISTLSLSVLQAILLVVALPFDAYFFVFLLPIIMTVFLLFIYKPIIGEKNYQRILAIPLALILVVQIFTLLAEIKGLEFYSDNTILYNLTTWQYIRLYVMNCGPLAVTILSLLIAGSVSLLEKEKSALPSISMCVAAVIRLLDGVSLLIRSLDVYLQQVGAEYVLFLVASLITDIFVMMCFAILMFPNFSKKQLITKCE